MPQLTLEYTDNVRDTVDFDLLFLELHEILSEVAGIRVDNCKSRAVGLSDYRVGSGEAGAAFVHLEVAILEGRALETKQELGRRMLEALRGAYAGTLAELALQITVEVRDLQKALYFKIPEGTLTPQ
jgi:5-carboxymethyl-2-hydroxymuconate isomerase